MDELFISIDINEQLIVVAKINPVEVLQYQENKTPIVFSEGMKKIKEMVKTIAGTNQINRIICSVKHPNKQAKTFTDRRLPTWQNQPIGQILGKLFSCQVQMENQFLLEALGESNFCGKQSKKSIAYYHLGREVMACRIQNQKLPTHNPSLNPGHQLIDIGHGNSIKLSDLVSEDSLEIKISKTNGHNREKILEDMAYNLARALHNTCLHWNPGVIILGGNMAKEIPLAKLSNYLKNLGDGIKLPPISKSNLENLAASYGAVILLREKE